MACVPEELDVPPEYFQSSRYQKAAHGRIQEIRRSGQILPATHGRANWSLEDGQLHEVGDHKTSDFGAIEVEQRHLGRSSEEARRLHGSEERCIPTILLPLERRAD